MNSCRVCLYNAFILLAEAFTWDKRKYKDAIVKFMKLTEINTDVLYFPLISKSALMFAFANTYSLVK